MVKTKKISIEQLYELHQCLELSERKIAEQLGTSRGNVRRHLEEYNMKPHIIFRIRPDKEELYENRFVKRMSTEKIAVSYGVTISAVKKWYDYYDMYLMDLKVDKDKFLEVMNRFGWNVDEVGEYFSVSGRTIRNWMSEFGISRNRGRPRKIMIGDNDESI